MYNGNKVLHKFLFWTGATVVENQEFAVVKSCNVCNEFESKSTKSVTVSDNNFRDLSLQELFQ